MQEWDTTEAKPMQDVITERKIKSPIQPEKSWTYVFQMKEQIGSSFYYPPIYLRSSGRFIIPIQVKDSLENYYPLRKAEAEFNDLQGDWYNNRTRYCIGLYFYYWVSQFHMESGSLYTYKINVF